MSEFSIGDVVRISGFDGSEVKMTVEKDQVGDTVSCVWFDKKGELHRDSFNAENIS